MGSNVKGISIFIIVLMLAAVIGIVAYGNGDLGGKTKEVSATADDRAEETAEASDLKLVGEDTRAFLEDDTFFNTDGPSYSAVQKVEGRELSLLMTSIEKDLRIRVVNNAGELVTGHSFCIVLNRADEYADEDQNGVIYIENLPPGEYEV